MHEPPFDPTPFEQLLNNQRPAPAGGVEQVFYRAGWAAALADRERSLQSGHHPSSPAGREVTAPVAMGPLVFDLPNVKSRLLSGPAFRCGAGLGLGVGTIATSLLLLWLGISPLPPASPVSPAAPSAAIAANDSPVINSTASDSMASDSMASDSMASVAGSPAPAATSTNRNRLSATSPRGSSALQSEPSQGFLARLLFPAHSAALLAHPVSHHYGHAEDWIAGLEPLNRLDRYRAAGSGLTPAGKPQPTRTTPLISVGTPLEELLKDSLQP